MAGFISKAGHEVTVFNRTSSKAEKWVSEYSGSKADTQQKLRLMLTLYLRALGMTMI